jgi:hypothetical protein
MYNGNKNEYVEGQNVKEDNLTTDNKSEIFKKYLHDIRNMRVLDDEMINNIRTMSNEDKMEIIILFNDVVDNLKNFFEY